MMSKMKLVVWLGLAACLVASAAGSVSPAAGRATPATAPATQPARGKRVIVIKVEGKVQVRASQDQPWRRAEVGMELNESADVRTGPRSSVTLVVPAQEAVVDRLGTMRVSEALESKAPRTMEGRKTTTTSQPSGQALRIQ